MTTERGDNNTVVLQVTRLEEALKKVVEISKSNNPIYIKISPAARAAIDEVVNEIKGNKQND